MVTTPNVSTFHPINSTSTSTYQPQAVLTLVLSLLDTYSSHQSIPSTSSSYIKSITRSAQESLVQSKVHVEAARQALEDKEREWQTVVMHREAVRGVTKHLTKSGIDESGDLPATDLLASLPTVEDFLQSAPADILATLPTPEDPEYEPALLFARLQHHLDTLTSREEQVTTLSEQLKTLKKDNESLRRQHAIADHHLNELGRGVEKVSQALEDVEKLSRFS